MKNLFMRKGIILTMALVVAIAAVPITFACYTGGWTNTNCTPTTECKLCFIEPVNAYDNELTFPEPKNVGQTTASIKDCRTLVVTVSKAYPGYNGIVDFCVKNTGSLPATITSIVTDNPNTGYLQLNLTGDVQPGVTLQPSNIKCGHLVIFGIPQQDDAQNRTFTFTITINFTCVYKNCDTAYAYGGCNYAKCFTSLTIIHTSNWGWTNGQLSAGNYTFYIYAGAAQCNLSKGKKVGTLTVNYDGSRAIVTYNMYSGYTMTETHLYVGNDKLPKKDGQYTVSPGQFPYSHTLNDATTDQYVITGLHDKIYVVAHAVVCWVQR